MRVRHRADQFFIYIHSIPFSHFFMEYMAVDAQVT